MIRFSPEPLALLLDLVAVWDNTTPTLIGGAKSTIVNTSYRRSCPQLNISPSACAVNIGNGNWLNAKLQRDRNCRSSASVLTWRDPITSAAARWRRNPAWSAAKIVAARRAEVRGDPRIPGSRI